MKQFEPTTADIAGQDEASVEQIASVAPIALNDNEHKAKSYVLRSAAEFWSIVDAWAAGPRSW